MHVELYVNVGWNLLPHSGKVKSVKCLLNKLCMSIDPYFELLSPTTSRDVQTASLNWEDNRIISALTFPLKHKLSPTIAVRLVKHPPRAANTASQHPEFELLVLDFEYRRFLKLGSARNSALQR